jgi:hypothetical protein
MKLYSFGDQRGIDKPGGTNLLLAEIVRPITRGSLVAITLPPDAQLRRHRIGANLLLLVVRGSGWVSGDDRTPVPIRQGLAACWMAGEWRQARAGGEGLQALVLD